MQTVYFTGRVYNGPQMLEIDAPSAPADPLADVRVTFADESRGIVGIVTLMACQIESGIGPAVLREYDAGRYDYLDI